MDRLNNSERKPCSFVLLFVWVFLPVRFGNGLDTLCRCGCQPDEL